MEQCGRWRTTTLSEVPNISARDSPNTARNVGDGDKLNLFPDANNVAAYHVFVGYVSNRRGYPVVCKMMSLDRIDAWLCSVTSLY